MLADARRIKKDEQKRAKDIRGVKRKRRFFRTYKTTPLNIFRQKTFNAIFKRETFCSNDRYRNLGLY